MPNQFISLIERTLESGEQTPAEQGITRRLQRAMAAEDYYKAVDLIILLDATVDKTRARWRQLLEPSL